ncbi:glycoside hydrolase superfamily [Penicillium hispanicum]|uniref:glycoside hydrolase superfamily n=1 Tax=Penicillium hispanicum TaxID=1080232 RepID=UPI00254152B9|nr:glycoside hydrolase superfamily [Penicillium hispanicum]KAJ5569431.1 glycoside hydrolase superfamily [Penicillium hispanicum]
MSLKGSSGGWWAWSTKKKILVVSIVGCAGLGIALKSKGDDDTGGNGSSGGNGTAGGSTTVQWQPAVGVKWQIEILYALNSTAVDAPVYDIDLFDNPQSVIS